MYTHVVASNTPHSTDHHTPNPPAFDDPRSPPSTVLSTPEPQPPTNPPTQHERERKLATELLVTYLIERVSTLDTERAELTNLTFSSVVASFSGCSAWAEKKEPGTHCLRILSSPRVFGNLEISVKSAPLH